MTNISKTQKTQWMKMPKSEKLKKNLSFHTFRTPKLKKNLSFSKTRNTETQSELKNPENSMNENAQKWKT